MNRIPLRLRIGCLLAALLGLLASQACDCDDAGFQGASPVLERTATSSASNTPGDGAFEQLPAGDRVVVDFGLVDTGIAYRRYLFLRNDGRGDLNLVGAELASGASSDISLACLMGGQFVGGCPIDPAHPPAFAPGRDAVIEITYAPAEVGSDSATATLLFNTVEHGTITVDILGQGVQPEIQVCISDCTGGQQAAACAQAGQLCQDQVGKDGLLMAFGDVGMGEESQRTVWVRDLGGRPVRVHLVALDGGDLRAFAVELGASGLPGILEPNSETTLPVTFHPYVGGVQTIYLVIGSDDTNEPEIEVAITGQGVAPRVCPEPNDLDFGTVRSGETPVMSFDLVSCGLQALELRSLALTPGGSADFSLFLPPTLPDTLEPGERLTVQVQYAPPAMGSDDGGVDIFSNDQSAQQPSGYTGTVALRGNALDVACDIQPDPLAVQFGVVAVGDSVTFDLQAVNVGSAPCTVDDIQITTNSAQNEFSLIATPNLPATFGPGGAIAIQLGYTPVDLGQDVGTLSLFANDKDTGEVRVDLNGFARPPEGEGPVAVCSVNPTQAVPFQTLVWTGSASYDTNGRPITEYRWAVSSFPAGSAARLVGTGPNRTTEVDLAGSYIASLVVVNDLGQTSQPCLAQATVTPTQDLWIEMYWAHDDDDMDLHLLAPGGSPRTSKDCFFSNCIWPRVLDWGQTGFTPDNPRLDLDDIPDTGPENINIADPAVGSYTVFVHDYPTGMYAGANHVTVNVYIDGALVATFENDISGDDTDWYVCDIDWPSGTVTPR